MSAHDLEMARRKRLHEAEHRRRSDYDNPLWQRPYKWDNVLQKRRLLFWDEISEPQKQREIDYQTRKNKELVK